MRDLHPLARPHHDGSLLYVPEPAPELGDLVPVFVRVPRGAGVDRVLVRTTPDGGIRFEEGRVDREDEVETWWRCDLAVHNPVTNYRFLLDGSGGYRWLNGTGLLGWDPTDADDFRLAAADPPPGWVADAVFYQIMPDRFADSGAERDWPSWALRSRWDDPLIHRPPEGARQLFGGDLPGIEARLDHLERLGVTAVYLTPFFPAGSYHRYDASSFESVDPVLGGDAALASLAAAMHRRGMRLIGDLTLNHCGNLHPWFLKAREEDSSAEAGFFYRRGPGFVYWMGVRTLPKFDHRSTELRHRLYRGQRSAAARWLRPPFGLDGWRVDVANMTGRYRDVDLTREVARTLRRTMAGANPDSYLVAEHMHDATLDLMGDGWHGTMAYAGFTWPVWAWLGEPEVAARSTFMGNPLMPSLPAGLAVRSADAFRAAIPWRSFAANLILLGSHDTPRWRTVAASSARAAVGAGLLLTHPGVPCVLYGDEVGLEGRWGEDGRVPMPWDEARWDRDLLERYRALIALRRDRPALRRGGLRWVHAGDDVLVYLREAAGDRVLVQASRRAHRPVPIPAGLLGAREGVHLLGGPDLERSGGAVELPGDGPAFHAWRL